MKRDITEPIIETKCKLCGKPFCDDGQTSTPVDVCKCLPLDILDMQSVPLIRTHGWICPVCGRGNNPDNQTCPCLI